MNTNNLTHTTDEYKFHNFSSVAKINRFLHITGRRSNGYHELQTVFQFLDFGDDLRFRLRNDSNVNLLTPIDGVDNDSNLIVKAAKMLQQQSNTSKGVDIELVKRLPMGGGLGGGSSNAATTLLALNKIWNTQFSIDRLAEMGLALGADVPVFVRGKTSFAEGVGEFLTPIAVDNPWFLVTIPNCSIATGPIFQHPELPRNTAKLAINEINIEQCRNDFEKLVRKTYPEVEKTIAWLLEYAPSRLTGTGACVFSIFANKADAEKVQNLLPTGTKSFVARGLSQSPILNEL
ncbi:4-(cytidine 5'-diphospho)-2-C-methyl-D-erythritol kinase [Thalassotalea crassostreae]|uniref:4-(cytidine 5'-diphospho)-2-C-methyl-D-erythritol kinase n=1 Tax=Thalassotalea crassostreae TaxID=1763536 RepID=UPI00083986D9|nr:4-(cytidine 5'-diphospho)-2-C-methyl-D-erythritol kinase [Thalassotalea crassostreae]